MNIFYSDSLSGNVAFNCLMFMLQISNRMVFVNGKYPLFSAVGVFKDTLEEIIKNTLLFPFLSFIFAGLLEFNHKIVGSVSGILSVWRLPWSVHSVHGQRNQRIQSGKDSSGLLTHRKSDLGLICLAKTQNPFTD